MYIFFKKIKKKIKYYTIKIYCLFLYKINKKKFTESKSTRQCEMTYLYLKHKYGTEINNDHKYTHTHEYSNKVWWCWFQGEKNAPQLNKACLKSLREQLTDRDVIVITVDNYKNYVEMPQFIIKKFEDGIISRTHFSDLLRTELLIKYGGTWIDSSVFCTSYNRDFFDKDLFVFKNWMRGNDSIVCSSWFITSEKNNPILLETRNLLYKYWEKNNFLLHYFLFHIMFTLVTEKYDEDFKSLNRFSNVPPHVLQFELFDEYNEARFNQIKQMSSFHKLSQKADFSKCNGKTNYDYIIGKEKV